MHLSSQTRQMHLVAWQPEWSSSFRAASIHTTRLVTNDESGIAATPAKMAV